MTRLYSRYHLEHAQGRLTPISAFLNFQGPLKRGGQMLLSRGQTKLDAAFSVSAEPPDYQITTINQITGIPSTCAAWTWNAVECKTSAATIISCEGAF